MGGRLIGIYKSNLENDGLCIIMWFYRNQFTGDKITLKRIEDDTGIPPATIHASLLGIIEVCGKTEKTAGTHNWPLSHIAYRYGYSVTWVGRGHGYVLVSKCNPFTE